MRGGGEGRGGARLVSSLFDLGGKGQTRAVSTLIPVCGKNGKAVFQYICTCILTLSIGSVAAGSLFAFLQCATMALIGIGALVVFAGAGASEGVKEKVAEMREAVGKKFVKAGEVIVDGAVQVGWATAVGAVRVERTVGGWLEKIKEKMKRE